MDKRKRTPHILIFNPDQWRGDVLAHMGNPAAITPNLDCLAQDGISFSNAFVQNTVCTPSRCSFMTGWYPHVRGHRTMHHMLHIEHNEPVLLKILRENGYFVWWGGKNDLVPAENGYKPFCDIKFQPTKKDYKRWNLTPKPNTHSLTKLRGKLGSDSFYSFYLGKLDPGDDKYYCDSDWGNVLGAIDFIKQYKGDKPLCIYMPLGHPHPPYAIEDPWYSMIDRSKMVPRIPTPKAWKNKPSLLKGLWKNLNMQKWTEDRWTELRATYYGMCARTDHQFGMVINALKQANLYNDTAVFFFSDHGDFTGDYGLVEKAQNSFEDCLSRIPFLIKLPAEIKFKPRISNAMVELIDFTATIYDLTGIEPGYNHFGKSLVPLITGKTEKHRDAVFCEGGRLIGEIQAMEKESTSDQNPNGWYYPRISLQTTDEKPYHSKAAMCRTKTHKYVKRLYEKDELYDLKKDPGELKNIIDNPAYKKILTQLKDRMLTWYQETCDVVPYKTDKRY